MNNGLLLGIDVGTGSARAGLFRFDGTLAGRGEEPIKTWQTTPNHVEQSSDDIWRAVCTSVKRALAESGARPDAIVGVGFDATCSLVAIDAAGKPVSVSIDGDDERNIVVWMDHRAVGDAAEINAGGYGVLDYVGGVISPEMETPKLRWLKRELPRTWQRTARWFDLPDYLTWRATGSDDRSLCSTVCKWTYLGHERRWDPAYFDAIGLGDLTADGFRKIGARVRVPGEHIGGLSAAAAADFGLPAGVPVAASLIDAHAGALGTLGASGHAAPIGRRMAIIAGTSACHLATAPAGTTVPGVWGPYFEALLPGEWLLEAGISASGAFLDHVLRSHPAHAAGDASFASLDALLTELLGGGTTEPELTHDLHLQPNVLGNRAPLADPKLSGGVSGWTLRDDRDDLARWYLAALQALAYATRHIVEAFAARGRAVDLLIASGGSAGNARWCQTHADALGIPVAVPEERDGVLLGSAMLGGAAAGTFDSLPAAMQAMTRLGRVIEPDPRTKDFHDRKYRVYRRMIDDQLAYRAIMSDPALRVTHLDGFVKLGFERVRDAFAEAQANDTGGAQLCIYRNDEVVVDLATGQDVANARPYTRETLTVLMSCTKAAVAMVCHQLAERGRLDLDAPVARYWPEFAANGKADVTVSHLLSHSAGLMSFDPDSPLTAADTLDWNRCTRALAAMKPLWTPGGAYLYHFITYGYLLGEVIRRVSGQSVGTYFANEIARPLSLEFWIGLPADRQHRVAPHFRSAPRADAAAMRERFAAFGFDTNDRLVRAVVDAFATTDGLIDLMTEPRGRAAEIPAGNGVGNARALAKLYAACIGTIDGTRVLEPDTVRRAVVPQTDSLRGPKPFDVLSDGSPQRFGLGFELPRTIMPMLGDGSFGHPGAGGRVGFADPETGFAAAYACNALVWDGITPDPRWTWCAALREIVL